MSQTAIIFFLKKGGNNIQYTWIAQIGFLNDPMRFEWNVHMYVSGKEPE